MAVGHGRHLAQAVFWLALILEIVISLPSNKQEERRHTHCLWLRCRHMRTLSAGVPALVLKKGKIAFPGSGWVPRSVPAWAA